ncbi:MAG: SpvB/TcaC N-terminal domain-containing protein, partial [Thermodesulfobacteriota bacterium]
MAYCRRSLSFVFLTVVTTLLAFSPQASLADTSYTKLTPTSLSKYADGAPTASTAQEAANFRNLFDRNTGTSFSGRQTLWLKTSFGASKTVSHLKLYGDTNYKFNVYKPVANSWEKVASLSLDARELLDSWNTFVAKEEVRVSELLFEFIPHPNVKKDSLLPELEIWSAQESASAAGGVPSLAGHIDSLEDFQNVAEGGATNFQVKQGSSPAPQLSNPDVSTVNVNLALNPRQIKRAYLTYESLKASAPIAVEKRLNNLSWIGGYDLPQAKEEVETWQKIFEEINPAWLVQGNNQIEFRFSEGQAVRNLRLGVETYNGWNFPENVSGDPAYDFNGATSVRLDQAGAATSLNISFGRSVEPEYLILHLQNSAHGRARLQYRQDGAWRDVAPDWSVNLGALAYGWNKISLPVPVSTPEMRLVLDPGAAGSFVAIDEIRVCASPVGQPAPEPELVVSFPLNGEYYDDTAYIQGFVRHQDALVNVDSLSVEEHIVGNLNDGGTFEIVVPRKETRFRDQAESEPWDALLAAAVADARVGYVAEGSLQKLVHLYNHLKSPAADANEDGIDDAINSADKDIDATGLLSFIKKIFRQAEAADGANPASLGREKHSEKVSPGQAKKIRYRDITLDIPAGAVDQDTVITIIPLNPDEVPPLDAGMVNVTFPAAGYRFLPHGIKFKKPIKISFAYSAAYMLAEQKADDVGMFYFHEQARKWLPLKKVRVDAAASLVTSETDHFTDIINSTLVVPEHPQALTYNPNTIKDIKVADPGAGINLIEAPEANNKGDAQLQYPLELPPGRNGMTPELAVTYNSAGGNGWLGLGWDLSYQAIAIDTRWGVPRYSKTKETETYSLNGSMLTPVAHRGQWQDRVADRDDFHTRIEGEFQKIVRHGNSPGNYWWEVIKKNGVRYFYGGEPGKGRVDQAVLADGPERNIFKWCLHKVMDPNGNTIEYFYDGSGLPAEGTAISGRQRYLKEVKYSGNGGFAAPYSVKFIRDHRVRPDISTDARPGFKTITADRLTRVEMRFKDQLVRSYTFNYEEGPYKKTRLAAISQLGTGGGVFHTHRFAYFDEIRDQNGDYKGFDPVGPSWETHYDRVSKLPREQDATALSGSYGTNLGGHFFLGIGPSGQGKNISGGVKIGFGMGDSEGTMAMIDLNGDGIQDKVFKSGDGFAYRPGSLKLDGTVAYEGVKKQINLPAIASEESESINFGGSINVFLVRLGINANENLTTGNTYFSDVNGDGLTDVVSNRTVYFNHLVDGVPSFSRNSALTPVEIYKGKGVVETAVINDKRMEEREEARAEQFPLIDAVRRWQAPFAGTVTISGGVKLKYSRDILAGLKRPYEKADGARVAIQHNGSELWRQRLELAATEAANQAVSPHNVENIRVEKGDRIYFRVQSVDDGAYDEVLWDPEIFYTGISDDIKDANNLNPYRYKANSDFTFAGRENSVNMPLKGTVRLVGEFRKNDITSDDVTVLVKKSGEVVYSRVIPADKVETISLNEEIAIDVASTTAAKDSGLTAEEMAAADLDPNHQFETFDRLEFYVQVDSAIDLAKISWAPEIYYTEAETEQNVVDETGNYLIRFYPSYDADLYPMNRLASHQESWVAPKGGDLVIYPSLPEDFAEKVSAAEIFFTVKSNGRLLGKRKITIVDGVMPVMDGMWIYLPQVTEGQELFFDFSARKQKLVDLPFLEEGSASYVYGDEEAWLAPAGGTVSLTPQFFFDDEDRDFAKINTKVLWTVSREGETLAVRELVVEKGVVLEPESHQLELQVAQDDELVSNYWLVSELLAKKVVSRDVQFLRQGTPAVLQAAGLKHPEDSFLAVLHSSDRADVFNEAYRSWSFAVYNSGADNEEAMKETAFKLSPGDKEYLQKVSEREEDMDLNEMGSFPLAPELAGLDLASGEMVAKNRWGGLDEDCWLKQYSMSSSRLGINNIRLPRSSDFFGASAVPRMSIGEGKSVSLGLVLTGSTATGESYSLLDYMDMNGDRFPDVIGEGSITYTGPTGAMGVGSARNSGIRESANTTWSLGASPGTISQDVKGLINSINRSPGSKIGGPSNADPRLGFSANGSVSGSESQVTADLRDMNGDGLPDRVWQNGPAIKVSLNHGRRKEAGGYSFGQVETWGAARLDETSTETLGAGGGFNSSFGNYAMGGGINYTTNQARTKSSLVDVNGDGLPDAAFIQEDNVGCDGTEGDLCVAFNTGVGFAKAVPWPHALGDELTMGETVGIDGGTYFAFGFKVWLIEITLNPGLNMSGSASRQPMTIKDVNGDGYPDHVRSPDSSELQVALNPHGKTNLLRSVTRPLGGSISLDYVRDGNSYEMPQSKWLLSAVTVDDGHSGDGVDIQTMAYSYDKPFHSRLEREFYGYNKVTVEQGDKDRGEYRKTVRRFRNDSYYAKGLLIDEILYDSDDKPYVETKNSYRFSDVHTGQDMGLDDEREKQPGNTLLTATIFPQLQKTEKFFYEGQDTAAKSTFTAFTYDEYGNVSSFFDAADAGAHDDVAAAISYYEFAEEDYIKDRPAAILVTDGGSSVLRQRSASYDSRGNLKSHTSMISGGSFAETSISYDSFGNISSVTGPANHKDQHYKLSYSYDVATRSLVEGVSDSHGYHSSAKHDYKFGKPSSTTDLNNNVISYQYDQFGRVTKIWGPYDQGGQATYAMSYHHGVEVPWAMTKNKGYWLENDTLDTITYIDGLKRLVQTKREAEVLVGGAKKHGMTASGKVVFDALGRKTIQGQPIFIAGAETAFMIQSAPKNPTSHVYDVLDRTTSTKFPDGALLTNEYAIRAGRFVTTTMDPEKKVKETVKDVRGAIQAVRELVAGNWQETRYDYDPLGQITTVTDAGGNKTFVGYDKLGRRTSINNPDSGLTEFFHDPAGNLLKKITGKLRAKGETVNYQYDYNRLAIIDYPQMHDVAYAYGPPGAEENRAGRIVAVDNGDIKELRSYGKLGEIVSRSKSIRSESPGHNWLSYTTKYIFDSMGRMRQLTYPDGEVLTYGYDQGGLLAKASGVKAGKAYDYLLDLAYDEFGQRRKIAYGNKVSSSYSYHPKTRRLTSIVTRDAAGRTIQNMAYDFDLVGNVTSLKNNKYVTDDDLVRDAKQYFRYDDLHRLSRAEGSYRYNPDRMDQYYSEFAYDSIGNFSKKLQRHEIRTILDGSLSPRHKTTYDFNYQYATPKPHAVTNVGGKTYAYDESGNMIARVDDKTGSARIIIWDEENRVRAVNDQGKSTVFRYDDQGARIVKDGKYGETVYVEPNFSIRNGEVASKHVFAGNTRLATKLTKQENQTIPGRKKEKPSRDFFEGDLNSVTAVSEINTAISQVTGEEIIALDLPTAMPSPGKGYGLLKDKSNNGQGQAKQTLKPEKSNNGQAKGQAKDKRDKRKVKGQASNGWTVSADASEINLPGNSQKGLENALAHGKG